MPQDYLIIDMLQGLGYVVILCLIGILLKLALTPPKRLPLAGDADFEAFYMDLCGSDLTVDFTRVEAVILYRTWQDQQQTKESERC